MLSRIAALLIVLVVSNSVSGQEIISKNGKLFRKICDGLSCRLEPISEGTRESVGVPLAPEDVNSVTPGTNTEVRVVPWKEPSHATSNQLKTCKFREPRSHSQRKYLLRRMFR